MLLITILDDVVLGTFDKGCLGKGPFVVEDTLGTLSDM